MTYDQVLEYLYERLPMFQRVGVAALKMDLSNTIRLLEAMGNPHQHLKAIHIAGTNGKGTSAHAISSILQHAGYRTGLYTSPHLKSFTERIKVDGIAIEEDAVVEFVELHKELIEEIKPSFFEVTVVMAFEYFKKKEVDVAVIETGLGGRLDSTNVITPVMSLITMIGKDHADLLGDTLPKIAAEKAGIIKRDVPVVISTYQEEVMSVFIDKAMVENAELYLSLDYQVLSTGGDLIHRSYQIFKDGTIWLSDLDTDITAEYFAKNIPGILKSIEILNENGFKINISSIRDGFRHIKEHTGLKGRMQVLDVQPLIIADISHNEPGLIVLFEQINKEAEGNIHIVFGVVKDKDLHSIWNILPKKAKYYWTQSSVPRSLPAPELKAKMSSAGLSGDAYENVNDAIDAAGAVSSKNDIIVVCGSAFVVAEINHL